MKEAAIAIFHGLGDCINVTTYLRPIKNKFPDCKITWITYSGYKGIVEHNPYIDKIVTFDDPGPKAGFGCDRRYPALRQQYPGLIVPASYMTGITGDGTLLGSFKAKIKKLGLDPNPFVPLLYVTPQEQQDAEIWLKKRGLDNFVLLEATFGSSQSPWGRVHTERAIKTLAEMGYQVLLTHRNEPNLEQFNEWADVFTMDVHYRYAPSIYNASRGFIGVSSGISCLVHTHQCRRDLPHLEFVRGDHWSTKHYGKQKKQIHMNMDGLVRLIRDAFV